MSEEVNRKKKVVEVNVVELKIELSEQFFDNMEKAKKLVADKRGYDITYGEYIEEAMNDLVKMVEDYSNKLMEASAIIQKQDDALGNPATAEDFEAMLSGEEPKEGDEEPKTVEGVPESMYNHLRENEENDPSYG